MGNYEMDAPEGLWEGISKGLAERKPAYNPVKAPRLSLSRTLFRAAGVAAVACIALLLGFFFLPFDAQKGNIAQDSPLLPSHQREDIAPQEDAASPYEKGTSAHKGAAIMASIRNNAGIIRNNAASVHLLCWAASSPSTPRRWSPRPATESTTSTASPCIPTGGERASPA